MFNYGIADIYAFNKGPVKDATPYDTYIFEQLPSIETQKQTLHGRRIGVAKDAIRGGDYLTKRQTAQNLIGTLAARPSPKSVKTGTIYITTDRNNVQYVSYGGHWYYLDGVQNVTLSPNTKPSLSVLYDVGYRIYATDFNHYFTWTGLTWVRESSNLYVEAFMSAPTEAGWGYCDGTTYTFSTPSGGTTSIQSRNLVGTGGSYLKYGAGIAGPNAAVGPSASGGTIGSSGAHTHTTDISGIVVNLPQHIHDHGNLEADAPMEEDLTTPWTSGITAVTATNTTGSNNQSLTHVHSVSEGPINTSSTSEGDCTDLVLHGETGDADLANCDHYHTFELSFNTEASGDLIHDHGIPILDVSGSLDSPEHFHAITGETGGYLNEGDPLPIDFSGVAPITSSSDGAHTHSISGLTIDATGEPRNIVLIPYVRL